jgi:hypothetical protein
VLVASLLHGLVCVLLHEYIVFKAYCSSGVDGGKSNCSKGRFSNAICLMGEVG